MGLVLLLCSKPLDDGGTYHTAWEVNTGLTASFVGPDVEVWGTLFKNWVKSTIKDSQIKNFSLTVTWIFLNLQLNAALPQTQGCSRSVQTLTGAGGPHLAMTRHAGICAAN